MKKPNKRNDDYQRRLVENIARMLERHKVNADTLLAVLECALHIADSYDDPQAGGDAIAIQFIRDWLAHDPEAMQKLDNFRIDRVRTFDFD